MTEAARTERGNGGPPQHRGRSGGDGQGSSGGEGRDRSGGDERGEGPGRSGGDGRQIESPVDGAADRITGGQDGTLRTIIFSFSLKQIFISL
jgi:hypothetical protein